MSITMIGLDTAKSVFQVHGVNETGKAEARRKLRRSELIPFFKQQQACTVVMEACGAAHHWARILSSLGHEVKLIAPEAVRPFVKKGKKNDPADAAALCAAASRPDMIFVPVKNIEQQGILALHSARSLLVKQQTMLANAMRGLATEFGLTVPQGIGRLEELLALVDADKAFPEKARQVFTGLFDQCRTLAESIRAFEAEIVAHARQDETARRLATIPGVGPITASLIAATVVDIGRFKSVHGTSRPGPAWCRDSIPPAERPALVGSPKRATGRSAGCLSSVPRRWFTEPRNGIASSGRGPEGFWSAARSGWQPSLWRTRWRASHGR
jgi:transposase